MTPAANYKGHRPPLMLRTRAEQCQRTADAHEIAGRASQARRANARANRNRAAASEIEATIPGFPARVEEATRRYNAIQAAIRREEAIN